jgi:hypothetical protein
MEEVFKIKKDRERAEDLFLRAKDRFEFIPFYPKEKVYKIIEESYESIKELVTSLMYLEGYKTLSHIKLFEFIQKRFEIFNRKEFKLIDNLRRFRNGTMYYGEKISSDFLENHFEEIERITKKLIKFVEENGLLK